MDTDVTMPSTYTYVLLHSHPHFGQENEDKKHIASLSALSNAFKFSIKSVHIHTNFDLIIILVTMSRLNELFKGSLIHRVQLYKSSKIGYN